MAAWQKRAGKPGKGRIVEANRLKRKKGKAFGLGVKFPEGTEVLVVGGTSLGNEK